MKPVLTAVTGGIGSGKSVVCRMLRTMGYDVYDCDLRAKQLMDLDRAIHRRLREEIHPTCIDSEGCIDRMALSGIVFADAEKLRRLNAIVHSAVLADLQQWQTAGRAERLFVETAILNSSGLYKLVDDAWLVQAPEALRVERVQLRSGLSAEQTLARIKAQVADDVPLVPYSTIINDGILPLLPQVLGLLKDAR